MLTTRLTVSIALVGIMILSAGLVSGQEYPNKPIRIVTDAAGGNTDLQARLIAQGISGPLGQPVIVDNRPSGVIPIEVVSKALPDGYILLVNSGTLWIEPLLRKTPYDPVRDFSPITLAAMSPLILVVHPSLPVKSVKDLIALAKAKPGELNYSSGPTGGPNHLAAELFKSMAGVNIVHVSYQGGGPAVTALMGGEVQLLFSLAATATPHVRSGKLRALAVSSAQPSALAPDLPTVAMTLPGYEAGSMTGMFAPAKTPQAIINRLNQEIVRFLKTPETKEKFLSAGIEPVGSSPAESGAKMKSEMAALGKVIKDAGIKAE
jgi:tripartite-type tricarboxylate transporter receptor subunit TctC